MKCKRNFITEVFQPTKGKKNLTFINVIKESFHLNTTKQQEKLYFEATTGTICL